MASPKGGVFNWKIIMTNINMISDQKLSEMRKLLNTMKKDKQVYLEFQLYSAELYRAKYLALLQQGFSKIQALKLCVK